MWYNHVSAEIERKKTILEKVLPLTIPEWQVKIPLLWRNMQLELALFLTDELDIKFLSSWWVLENEIMNNANLMAQFDYVDMNLKEMQESIINYNALYWLAITVIDGWDDVEKQPISDIINPLQCIPDPNNYSWSRMRFFWIQRRVSREYLENNPWFNIKNVDFISSQEITEIKRANNSANNLWNFIEEDDWYVDIYDHFTTYNWSKRLTTRANDRTILIRAIQLEPLTNAEKKKPNKVKFPIQLHRRKPKFWSFFWVSIADEILMFQDNITKLTNLQLIQANQLALWADIFVDSRLWIDTELLSQWSPWWRIIPIENDSWMLTQQWIYINQLPNPSNHIDNMIAMLEHRWMQTTNISEQSFWISQAWNQTKAEVQTLQQNINQILIWISNNYLNWQREYWQEHYRNYCLNFIKWKKLISLFQKWNAISKTLKPEDFIADWKVSVFITSKSQDALENDKEFNKLSILANLYLPNMKPWFWINTLLRSLWNKANIRNFVAENYIYETPDEMNAKANLSLINHNIEVPWPQPWEDYMTYIQIYKQALDTKVKRDILLKYELAYKMDEEMKKQQMIPEQQWQWNNAILWMAMNNLNQNTQTSLKNSLVK